MNDNESLCIKAMRGNMDAVRFLDLITNILHLWDDIHDKDKPLSDSDVDIGFWNALIELPRNAFYMQNFYALNTTLSVAIQNWQAANIMEDSDSDTDKEISFIIRSSYVDLVILCSLICGGYAWAKEITPEIRRFWHGENLVGYKCALADEKKARQKNGPEL